MYIVSVHDGSFELVVSPPISVSACPCTPPPKKKERKKRTRKSIYANQTRGMRVLDLFCGGGGLASGFAKEGCDVVGVDHDERVLEHARRNLPAHTFLQADLLQDPDFAPPPGDYDVLCAGPPCQPFSRASSRRCFEHDPRNGIDAFLTQVGRLRPRAVVLEQSPEVVKRTAYWDGVLARFRDMQYQITYAVVRMEYWGVPQARRRIILVALRDGAPPATLLHPPPYDRAALVGDVLPAPAPPMPAQVLPTSTLTRIDRFETRQRHARVLDRRKPSRTLTVRNIGHATNDSMRVAFEEGSVLDEILLDGTATGNQAHTQRFVTIREAAAIHTFPEDWRWDADGGVGVSRARDAKVIGNSVPPAFARALAQRVLAVLRVAGGGAT